MGRVPGDPQLPVPSPVRPGTSAQINVRLEMGSKRSNFGHRSDP
jgi:hypothetical protein